MTELIEAMARVIDPKYGPKSQRTAETILRVLAKHGFPEPLEASREAVLERVLGRPMPVRERWAAHKSAMLSALPEGENNK